MDDGIFRPLGNVIWNLFLASIPVLIAFFVNKGIRRDLAENRNRPYLWIPLLVLWFAFLPNTCYLLTEWRHYFETISSGRVYFARHDHDETLTFLLLTAFYMFYSGWGMLAFFLSIWPLDRLAGKRYRGAASFLKVIGFPACALGVYLGLVQRYNSWNIIHRHVLINIVRDAVYALARPYTASMIIGLAAILCLLYIGFDIWMDGFALRIRERSSNANS
jgi:uncharacterized membrane protein